MTYEPDFYDRDDRKLRCRPCGNSFTIDAGPLPVGDAVECPFCGLRSRIPTVEESAWPGKKLQGDPVRGLPMTERDEIIDNG